MLCMYMVYVQYVWFEYCCIHLSVRPSIRPCMCPLSLKRCIQCMYNMYVPRYYTIHVYYVHTPCMVFILYIIHLSDPSVHLCMCVLCVYFVCILCMYLGIILFICVVYVYGLCTLYMVCILLYPFVHLLARLPMHVYFL